MASEDDELEVLAAALTKLKRGEVPPPNYDDPQASTRVAIELAVAALRKKREDNPVHGLKLNWDIPIIPLAMLALAVGGVLTAYTDRESKQDQVIATIRQQAEASTARGLVYGPKVDALSESNRVQDERISRMADGLTELRKERGELTNLLWTIRNDVTTLMARDVRKP